MNELSAIELRFPSIQTEDILFKTKKNAYAEVDWSLPLYKSFNKRIENIIYTFDKYENHKISSFIKYPVYNTLPGGTYEEIYSLGWIENFIGIIPNENQQEIIDRIKVLSKNPFIKLVKDNSNRYCISILAPLNNFATTSNVIGIDPIVFIEVEINGNQYSLPLTQWI